MGSVLTLSKVSGDVDAFSYDEYDGGDEWWKLTAVEYDDAWKLFAANEDMPQLVL